MKAKYILAFILFATIKTYAQEPADALRYSWLTQTGTARNQAIGGAGASLGGEFTSLFINPAGLGFYKTDEFVLTPGYSLKSLASNYKNTTSTSSENNFNLGASGLLFSSPSVQGKSIRNFTYAIGVNKVADFSNHIYYKGMNNTSSYSEKYLEELADNNVTNPNNAATDFPFGSSLAFNTYLVDTVQSADGSVSGYRTLANPNYGLIQEQNINTTGGITDISFGTGANLRDKWFFGASISFPFLNYHRTSTYTETDASGDTHNNFNYFQSSETLQTKGVGINAKLGVIYKPAENVRLGLAIHTPTAFELTDEYSTTVTTDLEGYGGAGVKSQSSTDLNNGLLETKYNLHIPLKIVASGSYILYEVENVKNQRGFITADIEYINYKSNTFKAYDKTDVTSKDYYSSVNNVIDNLYKNAFNVRIGGELKFDTYMFRLGGAYYGNPYKNESADIYKVSGGLGYRNKGIFVDLTYVYSITKDIHYPYLLEDKPNVPADIKNTGGNIILTVGFKI